MINAKVKQGIKRNTRKAVQKGCENGLKEVIELLEKKVEDYAPRDEGTLKNSIRSKIKSLTGWVSTDVDYAIFQEEGTYKMSAANHGKGFFKPAIDFIRTRINAMFGKAIRSALRRY